MKLRLYFIIAAFSALSLTNLSGADSRSGGRFWETRVMPALVENLRALGIWDPVVNFGIARLRKPVPPAFEIEGVLFQMKSYLGSGLTADAYVIHVNGKDVVLKIAHETLFGRESLKKSIVVQQRAYATEGLHVPELISADPEGRWTLSEKIEGTSLKNYLHENPRFAPEVDESLRELYEASLKFQKTSGITLDLTAANIHLHEGRAILVDLGPLPEGVPLPRSYSRMIHFWKNSAGMTGVACVLHRMRALWR